MASPHQFQKAALAVLLCSESRLGQKWRKPEVVSEQELLALGFSREFVTPLRLSLLNGVADNARTLHFTEVAKSLQHFVWDDDPPHPPLGIDSEIVKALRDTDERR